jgi:hypothetical protein
MLLYLLPLNVAFDSSADVMASVNDLLYLVTAPSADSHNGVDSLSDFG